MVAFRHAQQVVDAEGMECIEQLVGDALVRSERDAVDERAPLTARSHPERAREMHAQPVADPAGVSKAWGAQRRTPAGRV